MNTELLRHIEILKTVPEIKKSINFLKLWCILKYKKSWSYGWVIFRNMTDWSHVWKFWKWHIEVNDWIQYTFIWFFQAFEIIWQVEERHLRMFLNGRVRRNMGWFSIKEDWYICFDEDTEYELIILLDNSKPYMEQSEEFYKKLNDWIVKEFNIKL